MKNTWLPALSLVLVSSIPALPIQAKPVNGPISPATRCAVFWSAMSRMAPQGSEAYTQMTQRAELWMVQAAKEVGDAEARRVLNANGPAEGNRVREMAGDSDAIQNYAATYSDCEAAAAAEERAAPAKPAPVVTEQDKTNGERAFRCAGMAQVYQDTRNFIAASIYGTPEMYAPIIDHFRPDITDDEKKTQITAGELEFTKLLERDKIKIAQYDNERKAFNPDKHGEMNPFSKDCARMANTLYAVGVGIGK